MARCGCGTGCTCSVTTDGYALKISGTGNPESNPYLLTLLINPDSPVPITNDADGLYIDAVIPPVDLVDAATIATNAALGSHFRVTLGGNRTLGNPTNLIDGQKIIWEVIQDGSGSRTLAFDTNFAFGTDIPSITLSTTLNKRDFIGGVYNSTSGKIYVTSFIKGY